MKIFIQYLIIIVFRNTASSSGSSSKQLSRHMRKEHLEVYDVYMGTPNVAKDIDFRLKLHQCPYYLIIIIIIIRIIIRKRRITNIFFPFQNKVRNDEKKKKKKV